VKLLAATSNMISAQVVQACLSNWTRDKYLFTGDLFSTTHLLPWCCAASLLALHIHSSIPHKSENQGFQQWVAAVFIFCDTGTGKLMLP